MKGVKRTVGYLADLAGDSLAGTALREPHELPEAEEYWNGPCWRLGGRVYPTRPVQS
jgi:hypothetical protein